jgi:hypothetical protein
MKGKELADALGISGAMVSKLKVLGMPMDSVERARQWREAYLQPGRVKGVRADTALEPQGADGRGGGSAQVGAPSYLASKSRREAAEAALAENRLREQSGELVRVAAVRQALAGKVTAMRDALLQIPPRLVPLLAAETNPAEIHRLLTEEIYAALKHVSGDLGV